MGRHYKFQDHPALIEICTHCRHADCVGTCPEYMDKYRQLVNGPSDALNGVTVVRAYGHGGYHPEKTGPNPRSLEAFGETHTLSEWAKRFNISYATLYMRIYGRGWPVEAALTGQRFHGHREKIMIKLNGIEKGVREWAAELGISESTILWRVNHGWNARECLYGKERR